MLSPFAELQAVLAPFDRFAHHPRSF